MDKIIERLPEVIWNRRRDMIRKYFAGSKEELEEKVAESLRSQYKKVFYGVFVSILFCVAFFVSNLFTESQVVVTRDKASGSETFQTVELQNQNKIYKYKLWIPPKVLTKKEQKKAFQNGFQYLEKQMKGKNKSLNQVHFNLNLSTEVPENPCEITWDSSDIKVIDTQGNVNSKRVKKPVIVNVTATMTYQNKKQSKIYHVCVIPYSKNQSKISKVKNKIKKIEEKNRTKETFQIPNKILGIKISKEKKNQNQIQIIGFLSIIIVGLLWYSEEENQRRNLRKSMGISLEEYPNIVSQFVLFLGAGMTIQGVIEVIAREEKRSEKYVYQQVIQMNNQLKLGMEPTKVLKTFGDQMALTTYGKFSTMMIRSLTRGSKDLLLRLREEESNVFLERKEIARRKGEEASTKLLLPMMLMLLVVLVMLMFPAFASFSM